MIVGWLVCQLYCMYGVFIIGYVDQCVVVVWEQDVVIMLYYLCQLGDKDFVVWFKQVLWLQNGKMGMWVGLCQQVDYFFVGCFVVGKFVGEVVWMEIFLDIMMMVIIKIE